MLNRFNTSIRYPTHEFSEKGFIPYESQLKLLRNKKTFKNQHLPTFVLCLFSKIRRRYNSISEDLTSLFSAETCECSQRQGLTEEQ